MSDYKELRSSAPAHSLLNPRFQYVPSGSTDLRKRFAEIIQRRALAAATLEGSVKQIRKRV